MDFNTAIQVAAREWAVISGAPFSFTVAVLALSAAFSAGVYWLLQRITAATLQSKDATIEHLKQRVADLEGLGAGTSKPTIAYIAANGTVINKRNFGLFGFSVRLDQEDIDGMMWPFYEIAFAHEPSRFEVKTDAGFTVQRTQLSPGRHKVVFVSPGFGAAHVTADFRVEVLEA